MEDDPKLFASLKNVVPLPAAQPVPGLPGPPASPLLCPVLLSDSLRRELVDALRTAIACPTLPMAVKHKYGRLLFQLNRLSFSRPQHLFSERN